MDVAAAAVTGALITAAIALIAALISSGGLNHIERLSNIIEKLEPGEQRDALIELRRQSIERYIQIEKAPDVAWIYILGIVCLSAGFLIVVFGPQTSFPLKGWELYLRSIGGGLSAVGLAFLGTGIYRQLRQRAGR